MPPDDRLQQCSAPVLRDVGVTTGLHLQVSPWHGRDRDMGYAVHEAGALPSRPVWETFQLITKRVLEDMGATWTCPTGDFHAPIGQL